MEKKRTRIFRFFLFILSGVFLLTGCISGGLSVTDGNGASKYGTFLSVTVYDTLANYQGIQSGWFSKIIKEKFNMELNIIAPNVSDDADSLYLDRFTSGDIGDLIICPSELLSDLADAGLLADMQLYLAGTDLLNGHREAIETLNEAFNGAVYAIPTGLSSQDAFTPSEAAAPSYGAYIRYDLYQSMGAPAVGTLEDLLPLLARMQAENPYADNGEPVYAFSLFSDWDGNMMTAAKQPACFYGYDECGFILMNADGTDYQSILDSDSLYIRALKFYFNANRLGLVDPDSPTQSYSDVFSKTQNGQVLFSAWPWLGQSAYNTAEHLNEGKAMMFVPIEDERILSNGCSLYGSGSVMICIGSQAKDIGRLADFIDWLYSSEGIAVACAQRNQGTAGPEGLTWEMTDDGPVLTSFGITALLENGDISVPAEWGGGTWADGVCQLNITPVAAVETDENGYPYYYMLWDSVRALGQSQIETDWQKAYGAQTVMEYLTLQDSLAVAPAVNVTLSGDTAELATIRKRCASIIIEYSWQMVFAEDEEAFETLYETMRSKAYDSGYRTVCASDLEKAKQTGEARINLKTEGDETP